MQRRAVVSLALSAALSGLLAYSAPAPVPSDAYGHPGSLPVATVEYEWHDDSRDRDVPVKVYYPTTGGQPLPVIIFSHGLGGSREGYEYLGRHWASHGYVSVHPTHIGSDTSVLMQGSRPLESMRKAAADLHNATDRPKDVSFVIDRLTAMNKSDAKFKGRLALDKIGVAGHSFGGYTALATAGQSFVGLGGRSQSLGDPRIKAVIAMSAPAKRRDDATMDQTYGSIKAPCFHMTGTRDDSPIGETRAEDRRIPFDHMFGGDNFLLIFTDGDHMVFSGRQRRFEGGDKDERFHELILQGSTAFWDAYLKGDADARKWLADGGFRNALGKDGTFEKRTGGVQH